VIRPRVRHRKADSSSEEVSLQSYQPASDPRELEVSILAALKADVSTGEIADVTGETHSTGRSNISRLQQSVGNKFVE
jgi:hypothetical protein